MGKENTSTSSGTFNAVCNSGHLGSWYGPDRDTKDAAQKDADKHNKDKHGGTKHAIVV